MRSAPPEVVVHVVDDEESVRDSLALLLQAEGFATRTHRDADALLAAIDAFPRSCVVTDVRMPGPSGLELLEALQRTHATTPVIVMTGHADVSLAVAAMKLGARDFIEKPFEPNALIRLVTVAVAELSQANGPAETRRRYAALSRRERQVLARLLEGATNKAIARELDLSSRTVEIYRSKLMLKMDVDSLSELVRKALQAGLSELGAPP